MITLQVIQTAMMLISTVVLLDIMVVVKRLAIDMNCLMLKTILEADRSCEIELKNDWREETYGLLENDKPDTPKSVSFELKRGITERESDVLKLLLKGYNVDRIANDLIISKATVKTHIYNIYRKTDVHSKQELINVYENETVDNSSDELKKVNMTSDSKKSASIR